MKIRFTKAPTFTKAIIASAVFAIVYLATTSNLPSCSDTLAALNSGECIERQSLLHTASGWLALFCLLAAVLLLALKNKNHILGWWQASVQQPRQEPSPQPAVPVRPQPQPQPQPQAWPQPQASSLQSQPQSRPQAPVPAPVPGRSSNFCARCGTRIIAGDQFCQGCGAQTQSH